jgi:hypothetical protein
MVSSINPMVGHTHDVVLLMRQSPSISQLGESDHHVSIFLKAQNCSGQNYRARQLQNGKQNVVTRGLVTGPVRCIGSSLKTGRF